MAQLSDRRYGRVALFFGVSGLWLAAAGLLGVAAARAAGTPSVNPVGAEAKAIYLNEVKGFKLSQQLTRIASDQLLLAALARGDVAAAQAEANAQLHAPIEHYAHVTRISVLQGSRVVVNATLNSDGVFVVAPGSRVLRRRGRVLGTLLLSLQDVTGFVKLVDHVTGAEALVRGSSGNVRTSLPAADGVRLPASGRVTIAGRAYRVKSFTETGWGNETLTVWVLVAT